jgi:hypothetical protein
VKGREIEFLVRATPPSETFPHGKPAEMLPAFYEPHELELMRSLRERMESEPPDSPERATTMNEVYVIHELKALFPGSRFLTDEEEALVRDSVDEMPISGHGNAQKVAPKMAEAETLFKTPTRMSARRATKADKAERDNEVPAHGQVGWAGRRGGRVPPFTVEEAEAVFRSWKGDEFERISRAILATALDRGEFHSEVLVGEPLSQPNVIGAATNSLQRRGLIERGSPAERRVSSETSRRKSDVWRLTYAGREVAEDLRRNEVI